MANASQDGVDDAREEHFARLAAQRFDRGGVLVDGGNVVTQARERRDLLANDRRADLLDVLKCHQFVLPGVMTCGAGAAMTDWSWNFCSRSMYASASARC